MVHLSSSLQPLHEVATILFPPGGPGACSFSSVSELDFSLFASTIAFFLLCQKQDAGVGFLFTQRSTKSLPVGSLWWTGEKWLLKQTMADYKVIWTGHCYLQVSTNCWLTENYYWLQLWVFKTWINRAYFFTWSRDSLYLKTNFKENPRQVFLKGSHLVTSWEPPGIFVKIPFLVPS